MCRTRSLRSLVQCLILSIRFFNSWLNYIYDVSIRTATCHQPHIITTFTNATISCLKLALNKKMHFVNTKIHIFKEFVL